MAEVHVIGQLVGARGFPQRRLFCTLGLHTGGVWKLLSGLGSGQTQVDDPQADDVAYRCRPLDVHFATKGLQGWPKLHQAADWGAVRCWVTVFATYRPPPGATRPASPATRGGPGRNSCASVWCGWGGPQLRNPEAVATGAADRFRLCTEATSTVHLQLGVLLRHFGRYRVEC
uniref:B9 domain-containing protein 2 n=1 Tax=Buteo japonicus TaxID=224669 RepID=A0A8C0BRW3_9AVES